MKTWFNIKATAAKNAAGEDAAQADVSIHDYIGSYGVNALAFGQALKAAGKLSVLNVTINSPGGSVTDGLAIYHMLRGSGAKVNVKVLGIAASIASVIAMAGDHIAMPANTFMMTHNALTLAGGDAEELRAMADELDKIDNAIVATYVGRTGQSEAKVRELMAEDTLMSAEEAKKYGFADEVLPAFDAKAEFDLETVDARVRTIFEARNDQAAESEEESAASDESAAVKPPAEEAEQEASSASSEPPVPDLIAAEARAAGLDTLVAHFGLKYDTLVAARGAIAEARTIRSLVNMAGRPVADADAFIAEGKSLGDVRAALLARADTKDDTTHIDTSRVKKVVNQAATKTAPTSNDTRALYRKQQKGY